MKKKKRKIGRIIVLAVILLVFCAVGVFAYLQKNNIEAVFIATQYSAEERRVKVTEREAALLEKIANELPDAKVQPLSEEEEALLNSGEISSEDALQLIMGVTEPIGENTNQTEEGQPEVQAPVQEEPSRLKELLAQVYLMKSSYSGQIEGLISQAKKEYIAGKGTVSKFTIGKKYMGIAGGLEAQCDSQMEAILAEIKTELEKNGGDLSLVEEIRAAYKSEKSAKKAALIEEYAS